MKDSPILKDPNLPYSHMKYKFKVAEAPQESWVALVQFKLI